MSELLNTQVEFTLILGKLILFTYSLGFGLTLGEGYDDDGVGHAKGSTHYIRLGQDLNVIKDGVWLKGRDAEIVYNKMHDFWDSIGGAKRIAKDLNHFSKAWKGMR
ncbi:MAG: hypothetical protein WC455_22440 [Dehalococcoidia bacterium]|jgi:hypothetical protein